MNTAMKMLQNFLPILLFCLHSLPVQGSNQHERKVSYLVTTTC